MTVHTPMLHAAGSMEQRALQKFVTGMAHGQIHTDACVMSCSCLQSVMPHMLYGLASYTPG